MSVERSGDPVSVVKQAEKQLEEAFKPKPINSPPGAKYTNIVQIAPAWSEITKISNSFTWLNEDIFKAKALVKYDEVVKDNSPPVGVYSYDWDRRYEKSSEAWSIQEDSSYYIEKAKMAIVGGVGGAVTTLVVLWLLAWGWQFLLTRIRELSEAIRGKNNS
jgi:hypothetical protein